MVLRNVTFKTLMLHVTRSLMMLFAGTKIENNAVGAEHIAEMVLLVQSKSEVDKSKIC